jgi:hypothetical protein
MICPALRDQGGRVTARRDGVASGGESRGEVGRHGVAPDVRRGTKPSNYPDLPPPYVGGYNRVRAQSRSAGQGRDRVVVRRGDDARYFQISVPVRVAQATGLCRPATRRMEWRRALN